MLPREREGKEQMKDAFFGIDSREIGVGGKAFLGQSSVLFIVLYAVPTAFLVAAQDKLNCSFWDKSFVFECL
jgi:hypothetical protein